ncbi:hypothetical protein L3Q65_30550 [Amycolatopsis sp. FU40]|uniref:hypothetical protein n=1 Tax=Amycolatopsis sp. FU40 TaxID=2914159 RepID=UPI001F21C0E4|nr:hypothetical protein [Amycolatopsis sp. FU40]UKD52240.1 hypothetical protein L3Q65_30550 [Amycolatopsis sp. FU40]
MTHEKIGGRTATFALPEFRKPTRDEPPQAHLDRSVRNPSDTGHPLFTPPRAVPENRTVI